MTPVVPRSGSSYIELDTTYYNNPYSIPNTSTIVLAVQRSFSFDSSKKLIPLYGRDAGLYRLETESPEAYQDITDLEFGGTSLAKVNVRTVEQYLDQRTGKTFTKRVNKGQTNHREDELLITLKGAAKVEFSMITDDMLYEEITDMGIGRIKRGITDQKFPNSDLSKV